MILLEKLLVLRRAWISKINLQTVNFATNWVVTPKCAKKLKLLSAIK